MSILEKPYTRYIRPINTTQVGSIGRYNNNNSNLKEIKKCIYNLEMNSDYDTESDEECELFKKLIKKKNEKTTDNIQENCDVKSFRHPFNVIVSLVDDISKFNKKLDENTSLETFDAIVEYNLIQGLNIVNFRCPMGETFLHWAAFNCLDRIIIYLIDDCKLHINCKNKFDCNPLFYAIKSTKPVNIKLKTIKLLISKGADYRSTSSLTGSSVLEPMNFLKFNIMFNEQERRNLQTEFDTKFQPIKEYLKQYKEKVDFISENSPFIKKLIQHRDNKIDEFNNAWKKQFQLQNNTSEDVFAYGFPSGSYFDDYCQFVDTLTDEFIYLCANNHKKFCYHCGNFDFDFLSEKKINLFKNLIYQCNNRTVNYYPYSTKINFISSDKIPNKLYCSKECCQNDSINSNNDL